jgi:amidase
MELAYATARQIAKAIASGKISCTEVVKAQIARIEALDGAVNAVVVRDFDRALTTARSHDRKRKKGDKLPPLFGVPMTVKESYDVAGLPTCWGVQEALHMANADALAIARLKQAGTIVTGKTNVPVMLMDWQSRNPVYGQTNNPWDVTRWAGGSSGGSAASLAAGFAALEAGSDIAGSLRDPAHFCGIYAHKPTWNILPLLGHSLAGGIVPTDLSVIGPMARSAGDLDIALHAMAGPAPIERGLTWALPTPRQRGLKGLRVAILADHQSAPVEREIVATLHELARHLKGEGVKISLTARPDLDLAAANETYLTLLNAALSARMPDDRIAAMRELLAKAGPERADEDFVVRASRSTLVEHRIWLRLNEERHRARRAWDAFFQDWDVLIAPVASMAAQPHDPVHGLADRRVMINGVERGFIEQLFWAGIATMPLLPATSAPLGFTEAGLPFGMQILGAPYEDRTTITVAAALEKSWLGFQRPPHF